MGGKTSRNQRSPGTPKDLFRVTVPGKAISYPLLFFIELVLDGFHLFRVGQKLIRREGHGLAGEDRCLSSLFRTRRFPLRQTLAVFRPPLLGRHRFQP